jgi:hypothetical protein
MQTVLSWINPNTIPVVIKIYRNTTEVDRSNPGAALVTLSDGETSWIDPTALAGVTYYYLVEVISASNPSEKILSRNYKTMTGKERGPGPQILKYGDLNLGYFGTVTSTEFLSRQSLWGRFTLPAPAYLFGGDTLLWHKFVRNNKIIYIPETALAGAVTWPMLYAEGLVFGYDGVGKGNPAYLPATKVNQLATIRYGYDDFIVRLPTGFDDTHTNQPGSARVNEFASPYANEWDDLYQCIHAATSDSQKLPNVTKIVNNSIGYYGFYSSGAGGWAPSGAFCQETISSTSVVGRGGGTSAAMTVRGQITAYKSAAYNPGLREYGGLWSQTDKNYCSAWWPLLELVE